MSRYKLEKLEAACHAALDECLANEKVFARELAGATTDDDRAAIATRKVEIEGRLSHARGLHRGEVVRRMKRGAK